MYDRVTFTPLSRTQRRLVACPLSCAVESNVRLSHVLVLKFVADRDWLRPSHRGNRSVGRNMLVDSNSQRGSVVLRGIEIDLDSDIGCGFIIDCCRFCEGDATTSPRHRIEAARELRQVALGGSEA